MIIHDDIESDNGAENTSGKGKGSEVPPVIRTWNWGAFFLSALWGIFNKTYIALWSVIPLMAIPMAFILGFKGSEWAWQNKRWKSIEHFQQVQKKWAVWGIIFFVVFTVIGTFVSKIIVPIIKLSHSIQE
ncbi:MAG: hypothetical protein JXA06_11450 [Bacteroidetes bacterium]|nr:hypothetical protein [Bacteroidota bacterium]